MPGHAFLHGLTAVVARATTGHMELPLVFMDGPWRLSMGLRALEPGQWLWLDRHHAAETAERRRLLALQRDEVLAMPPGTEAACHELLAMVRNELATHHGGDAADHEGTAEPLAVLGGLVQEDFCLLMRADRGEYVLRAGVLCFPLHWRLHDKLNLPLRAIHAPVPGFADKLGDAADRFLASLRSSGRYGGPTGPSPRSPHCISLAGATPTRCSIQRTPANGCGCASNGRRCAGCQ